MYSFVSRSFIIITFIFFACEHKWNNPLESETQKGEIVVFYDSNLESAIRVVINQPSGEIYTSR